MLPLKDGYTVNLSRVVIVGRAVLGQQLLSTKWVAPCQASWAQSNSRWLALVGLALLFSSRAALANDLPPTTKLNYASIVPQYGDIVHFPVYLPLRLPAELQRLQLSAGEVAYYRYTVMFKQDPDCFSRVGCIEVLIIGAADANENTPDLAGIPYTLRGGVTGYLHCAGGLCGQITVTFEVKHHVYVVQVNQGTASQAIAIAKSMIEVLPGKRPIVYDRTKYLHASF